MTGLGRNGARHRGCTDADPDPAGRNPDPVGSLLHCPWQGPAAGRSGGTALQPPAPGGPVLDRRQDQLQTGGERQGVIPGGRPGRAERMAVGRSQHLQPALAPPALGQQLFTRIDGEPAAALARRLPDVEAGPDPLQPPGARIRRRRAADLPQQQGAALGGQRSGQHPLQDRERLCTDQNRTRRGNAHTSNLGPFVSPSWPA